MGGNSQKKQQQRLAALLSSTLKDHPELLFEDSSDFALFSTSFPLRGPALPPPPQPQHSHHTTPTPASTEKPQGQEQSPVASVAAGPPVPPPIAFLGLRENDCPEVEEYLGPQTLIFTFHLPASLQVADIYVK